MDKYENELKYWMKQYNKDEHYFRNNWYETLFLGITQNSKDFFKDKVIADWGCGPRGSLTWADNAKQRIGIDVLTNLYYDNFFECMRTQNMEYITSSEKRIPLPDHSVDVVSTINSLDHCTNMNEMVSEMFRILKPGGVFVASINLYEPSTPCEPQVITRDFVEHNIIKPYLSKVLSIRYGIKDSKSTYRNLLEDNLVDESYQSEPVIMWLYGVK